MECLTLLIERGASVNFTDNEKKTPLHTASRKGFFECSKVLLEKGANVNATDQALWTPLHEATSKLIFFPFLLSFSSFPLLFFPLFWENSRIALIKTGEGSLQCLLLLIEAGAQVTAADKDGCTPLHLASRCGHLDCLQLLLLRGAKVDFKDECGWTALHESANEGNSNCLEILLKAAAIEKKRDPNAFKLLIDAQEDEGNTALHKAADSGDFNCIRLLIEFGASLSIRNKANLIPSDLCADPECSQYFALKLMELDAKAASEEEEEELEDFDFKSSRSRISGEDAFVNNTERMQSIEQIIERVVSLSNNPPKKPEPPAVEPPTLRSTKKKARKDQKAAEKKKEKQQKKNVKNNTNKRNGIVELLDLNGGHKGERVEEKKVESKEEVEKIFGEEEDKEKIIFDFQLKAAQEAIVIMEEDLEFERQRCQIIEAQLQQELEEKEKISYIVENLIVKRIGLQCFLCSKICSQNNHKK